MQKPHKICASPGCKNKSRDKHCPKCYSRKMRANKPMYHCWLNLKHNSKRRGVPFALTFEEFKEFCYEENFIPGSGRSRDSFSVDRDDPRKGYILSNITKKTIEENSRKGNKILQYDWRTKQAVVVGSYTFSKPDKDLPF